jgi:membrane-bound ClpP family serine protease
LDRPSLQNLARVRPRPWPFALAAVALLAFGFRTHPALGFALAVFGLGLAFHFPDLEDQQAAREAERRLRDDAARRRARAATPLRPRGEVEVDGRRRPARLLEGRAEPGAELEVVNEVDGELIVRRR